MEILYENSYLCDERIAGEYIKHSILRSARLYVILFMFIVITTMLTLVKHFEYAGVFAVLFAIWMVVTFRSFGSSVERLTNKYISLSRGEVPVARFEFGDDCFVAKTPSTGVTVVPYSELKRASSMKETIMLSTRGGVKYALPKGCFKKGEGGEFLGFIKEKIKQARH